MVSQRDVDALIERGRTIARGTRKRLRRLTGRFAVHRDVFLGPDGEPTPAAMRFLSLVSHRWYGEGTTFHADPREHARREGMRMAYLDLLSGLELDGAKLAALTRQLRETDDD